ncbi:MAG TPA: nucleoside transporter [Bacteroidetes bacterium]|nr:nucleoside transporter [Bacteroidota bacterium]
MHILQSLFGIASLIGFAWLLSRDRRHVSWRVVGWGLGLQLVFAFFVFVVPAGVKFFLVVNDIVNAVLDSAGAGTTFVFGRLAVGPGGTDAAGQPSLGFILATQALPTIVFFAALVSMLYYLGVMQWLIRGFSWLFTRLMRISGAESLCASSNIFVGIESALVIKPHLKGMTRSELNTILTAGMATIASSMLAVYIMILRGSFPTIAGHLVSASILNAPAAIVMSKLLFPEDGRPETLGLHVKPVYEKESNLFAAIIGGANSGVRLLVGIIALLLAFLGIVALVDKIMVLLGAPVNSLLGLQVDWSLKGLLGYLFYPFTLLLGVPLSEAGAIAKIIGERAIVTEVTAFQDLAALVAARPSLSPRTIVVTTYALTGFAHVASLAIFVGGISALVPERTRDLAGLGFRALLGATLATLLTASMAGLFFSESSILFG